MKQHCNKNKKSSNGTKSLIVIRLNLSIYILTYLMKRMKRKAYSVQNNLNLFDTNRTQK